MSSVFDVIPYEDLTHPFRTIGTGSFGSVYRSEYLGLPVALKQIQPSKDYDVQKYFEREWRLMKEARHPNVVLYLGLSRSPEKVTYIVSEFVEGGNMRSYIHHKRKPFPWTMRVSFAIDVARALAYLHARKCIHRDLKPENLLLTANGRVKITDFGFARIAPRNDDEQKRITFCGTDAYMSPEILLGESFGLSTDIFSLGVIFCEVISRTLADDSRGDFRRNPATWGLDAQEVRQKANDGCPEDFVQLSLDCLQLEPNDRPDCREILERLSRIEVEILQREKDSDTHVGSVKFVAGKRPNMAPRIPSFGAIKPNPALQVDTKAVVKAKDEEEEGETSSNEDEFKAALKALENVKLISDSGLPLLGEPSSSPPHDDPSITTDPSAQESDKTVKAAVASSQLTIKPTPDSGASQFHAPSTIRPVQPVASPSLVSVESFHTASSAIGISIAHATEDGPSSRSPELIPTTHLHRFTIIRPAAGIANSSPDSSPRRGKAARRTSVVGDGWKPLEMFFAGAGALFGSRNRSPAREDSAVERADQHAKCDLCGKRLGLGWKTVLECDDCGLRAHVKCGEFAPKDCGLRHRLMKQIAESSTAPPSPPRSPGSPARGLPKLVRKGIMRQ